MNPTKWERIKKLFSNASTVRGFILLIGLLGYNLTPEEIASWIGLVDALVYILYEICRKDSATKAVDQVLKKMSHAKIILCLLLFPLFLFAGTASAVDLYITVEGNVDRMEVLIENADTNAVVEEMTDVTDYVAEGVDAVYDGMKYRIMNMDHLAAAVNYRITVKVCKGGWCDSSDPLLTGYPGIASGSLRIQ